MSDKTLRLAFDVFLRLMGPLEEMRIENENNKKKIFSCIALRLLKVYKLCCASDGEFFFFDFHCCEFISMYKYATAVLQTR